MPYQKPKKSQDPNAPVTDKDRDASELYPKIQAQLNSLVDTLKATGVSDKRADPKWEADPDDPDATAPLIDTDPPTDAMGQAKEVLKALRPKVKSDFRKYNGRALKSSSADDAFAILNEARKSLAHWHERLQTARDLLAAEAAQAQADRANYFVRNKDKAKDDAARRRRLAQLQIREADRIERELAQGA